MSGKNYFKDIGAKIAIFAKYFRVFRLLIVIAYLFYLETLMVNIFYAIEYVPTNEEVRIRFFPIKTKNEVISSIEKYFSDKENNLVKNSQKEIKNNPFLPRRTDSPNILNNVIGPENNVIN